MLLQLGLTKRLHTYFFRLGARYPHMAIKPMGTRAFSALLRSSRIEYDPASIRSRNFSDKVKIDKPSYHLSFTCNVCKTRSGHVVSKQGYDKGTVLVQCPECKNRHLIADHLNVFGQGKRTLEDILKEKGGEIVQKGTVNTDPNAAGDFVWEPQPDQTAPPALDSKPASK